LSNGAGKSIPVILSLIPSNVARRRAIWTLVLVDLDHTLTAAQSGDPLHEPINDAVVSKWRSWHRGRIRTAAVCVASATSRLVLSISGSGALRSIGCLKTARLKSSASLKLPANSDPGDVSE
jgi:hypothetical protein